MTNQSNFAGRIQDNWQQRASERTTFRGELRVIPRRLMKVLFALYLAAVVVVVLASIFAPHSLPQPFVAEPLALRLLAMFGIVTGIAAGISAFVLFYAYIACDAKRRGMNPVLWVLVAILVPYVIGIILYFVVREPLPMNCPQCGRKVDAHFNFCPICQFNLRPNCPECRRTIRAGDRFCPHCGFSLQQEGPAS